MKKLDPAIEVELLACMRDFVRGLPAIIGTRDWDEVTAYLTMHAEYIRMVTTGNTTNLDKCKQVAIAYMEKER